MVELEASIADFSKIDNESIMPESEANRSPRDEEESNRQMINQINYNKLEVAEDRDDHKMQTNKKRKKKMK